MIVLFRLTKEKQETETKFEKLKREHEEKLQEIRENHEREKYEQERKLQDEITHLREEVHLLMKRQVM